MLLIFKQINSTFISQ